MRMDNQSGRSYGFKPKTRAFGVNPSGDPVPAPAPAAPADETREPIDAEIIGGVITQGVGVATHIIDGMNAEQIARLHNSAQAAHDAILLQIAQANATGNAAQVQSLQAQNAQMQALLERTAPKDNTMLYVGLGVGGIVLLGGIALLMMKRNNPGYSARNNVVVTGSTGKKHFVTAAKRRRQLAKRRAA